MRVRILLPLLFLVEGKNMKKDENVKTEETKVKDIDKDTKVKDISVENVDVEKLDPETLVPLLLQALHSAQQTLLSSHRSA